MENVPDLFAFIGEDELGSGEIGLKQGMTGLGITALVSVDEGKIRKRLGEMQLQANHYGTTIRLVQYTGWLVLEEIRPQKGGS